MSPLRTKFCDILLGTPVWKNAQYEGILQYKEPHPNYNLSIYTFTSLVHFYTTSTT